MISPQQRKLLEDMRTAASDIAAFTDGKSSEDFLSDKQFRYSVECAFEILGEALAQLSKLDPDLPTRITDHRKIISFRNVLIHGYSTVDSSITWLVVGKKLPVLQRELDEILKS